MFLGRPSVSVYMRPCMRASCYRDIFELPVRGIHQTLVDDVVEATDELIRL